jgi:hypothetical protein
MLIMASWKVLLPFSLMLFFILAFISL